MNTRQTCVNAFVSLCSEFGGGHVRIFLSIFHSYCVDISTLSMGKTDFAYFNHAVITARDWFA